MHSRRSQRTSGLAPQLAEAACMAWPTQLTSRMPDQALNSSSSA